MDGSANSFGTGRSNDRPWVTKGVGRFWRTWFQSFHFRGHTFRVHATTLALVGRRGSFRIGRRRFSWPRVPHPAWCVLYRLCDVDRNYGNSLAERAFRLEWWLRIPDGVIGDGGGLAYIRRRSGFCGLCSSGKKKIKNRSYRSLFLLFLRSKCQSFHQSARHS